MRKAIGIWKTTVVESASKNMMKTKNMMTNGAEEFLFGTEG